MLLDEPAPHLGLAMDRPLFTPPDKPQIDIDVLAVPTDLVSLDALFATPHVDKTRLRESIRRTLQSRGQVSLEELIQTYPLEQGLAELIAYLSLAADDPNALIDDNRRVVIAWVDNLNIARRAFMPIVVFKRSVPVTEATF